MFRILTVCTGNICRSVLAEGLLRRDLFPDVLQISSTGIMAVPDGAVPPRQLKIARNLGVEGLERHQTRMTTLDTVQASDLILAMSRGHRTRLLRLDTSATRRTFTIREFARLAPAITAEEVQDLIPKMGSPLQAAVEAVARKRGTLPPPKSEEDLDVIDPYRRSRAIFRQSRDQLLPAAQVTAQFLNGIVDLFGAAAIKPEIEVEIPEVEERNGSETIDVSTAVTSMDRAGVPAVQFPSRSSIHQRKRTSTIGRPVQDSSGAHSSSR